MTQEPLEEFNAQVELLSCFGIQRTVLQFPNGAKEHPNMSEKEIVIPLAELTRLEVSCKCGSGVVFALLKRNPNLPYAMQSCPNCDTPFSDPVKKALGHWRSLGEFYQQSEEQFSLKIHRVRVPQKPEK